LYHKKSHQETRHAVDVMIVNDQLSSRFIIIFLLLSHVSQLSLSPLTSLHNYASCIEDDVKYPRRAALYMS